MYVSFVYDNEGRSILNLFEFISVPVSSIISLSSSVVFTIDSNFPTDSYWLYDMQGQLLKKNVFSHDKIINLENLDSGTYFLKIQNKEYQQKIVKIVKE